MLDMPPPLASRREGWRRWRARGRDGGVEEAAPGTVRWRESMRMGGDFTRPVVLIVFTGPGLAIWD